MTNERRAFLALMAAGATMAAASFRSDRTNTRPSLRETKIDTGSLL